MTNESRLSGVPNSTFTPFRSVLWALVFSCIGFLSILFSGAAGSLHFLYPAFATLVGGFLLRARPVTFVGFVFWLWVISPLVRRVVDYRSAYLDPSPILLAPLLVMLLAAPRMLRVINERWSSAALPFALILAGLVPGIVSGVVSGLRLQDVFRDAAMWIIPILWGSYVAFNKDAEAMKTLIGKHFVWAVMILGSYGIYQFLNPPNWDRFWLENLTQQNSSLGEQNSFGLPNPFEIRVWSTMNGPGVFSIVVMCGILIVITGESKLRIPAAILGIFSLGLSQVRISWIALFVGLIWLGFSCVKHRRTVALVGISCVGAVVSLAAVPELRNTLYQRVLTFTQLRDDDSLNERAEMHGVLLSYVLEHPLGRGLGGALISYKGYPLDTGILNIPFVFGWTGTLLVGLGLWKLGGSALRVRSQGEMTLALKVVFVCILVHLPAGEVTTGAQGFFFWTVSGLLLAESESSNLRSSMVLGTETPDVQEAARCQRS